MEVPCCFRISVWHFKCLENFRNKSCSIIFCSRLQEQLKLPKTFNTCLACIQRELCTTEATDRLHLQETTDFLFLEVGTKRRCLTTALAPHNSLTSKLLPCKRKTSWRLWHLYDSTLPLDHSRSNCLLATTAVCASSLSLFRPLSSQFRFHLLYIYSGSSFLHVV